MNYENVESDIAEVDIRCKFPCQLVALEYWVEEKNLSFCIRNLENTFRELLKQQTVATAIKA